ncbi:hypothetical protein HYS31_08125 [Candidatus Woesearchaeota archaeon]|nr:hypothetical protein [Candidatus Woesearchaeota archaeon]
MTESERTKIPRQIPINFTPYTGHYMPQKVLKFGGSSMRDGLESVVEIVSQNLEHKPIVVPSALKGVTDELISLSDYCFKQIMPLLEQRVSQGTLMRGRGLEKFHPSADSYASGLAIAEKYAIAAKKINVNPALIYKIMWKNGDRQDTHTGLQKLIIEYLADFDNYISRFYNNYLEMASQELGIKRGIFNKSEWSRLDKRASEIAMEQGRLYMQDKFAFWGEFSSSRLLLHAFKKEGRMVFTAEPSNIGLLTEMQSGGAGISENISLDVRKKIRRASQRAYDLYIIGGYTAKGIAKTSHYDEKTLMLRTTLGRGGSDLTAVILGAALEAPVLLYSDTNGVLQANPNLVNNPGTIAQLSREEGLEFARNGSKILYDKSMEYAIAHNVDVWSRNTFNPSHPGTYITKTSISNGKPIGLSFLEKPDLYILAVIGHGIGNSPEAKAAVERVREVLPFTDVIRLNLHSITFALPKDAATKNAQMIYNAVMGIAA